MTRFGDFRALCEQAPSYPWCNLFYRQILENDPTLLIGLSADRSSAPVGINPECGIPRVGTSIPPGGSGSLANIANIVACAISVVFVAGLLFLINRRKAAVGRVEFRAFCILYLLSLPFQILTTGSLLEQGSLPLVVLTALHAGIVAALFWILLANSLVATQIVEDGTPSSLIPFYGLAVIIFAGTTYISLDVGIGITNLIGRSDPLIAARSIPLFVLVSVWPAFAALTYFLLMSYIVVRVLSETKPMLFYILSAALFVLSQLDYFFLSKVICKGVNAKLDGSFIATVLETASVGVLFLAWKSITEGEWADDSAYV